MVQSQQPEDCIPAMAVAASIRGDSESTDYDAMTDLLKEATKPQSTVIVLLGKTGSGKSTLATCICNQDVFPSNDGWEPDETVIGASRIEISKDGTSVTILDTKGILDSSGAVLDGTAVELIGKLLNNDANGVIIVCISMFERVDLATIKTLAFLQGKFGYNLWSRVVIALTKADAFNVNNWLTKKKPTDYKKSNSRFLVENFLREVQERKELLKKYIMKMQKKSEKQPDSSKSEKEPDRSKSEKEPDRSKSEKEPERSMSEKEPERSKSEKEPERSKSEKEPERSMSEKEPERSKSEKEPERSVSVKEPERSMSVKEPERSKSEKEPDRSKSEKEPDRSKSEKEPERSMSEKEPDRSKSEKEPDRSKSEKEPERSMSEKEPERSKSEKEPERSKSEKEPERSKSEKEPERSKSEKEPERSMSVKEPERSMSVKEPERSMSVKEPERGMSEKEYDELLIPVIPTSNCFDDDSTKKMVRVEYGFWFDQLLVQICQREGGCGIMQIHSKRLAVLPRKTFNEFLELKLDGIDGRSLKFFEECIAELRRAKNCALKDLGHVLASKWIWKSYCRHVNWPRFEKKLVAESEKK